MGCGDGDGGGVIIRQFCHGCARVRRGGCASAFLRPPSSHLRRALLPCPRPLRLPAAATASRAAVGARKAIF
jgi:hypothetical protein